MVEKTVLVTGSEERVHEVAEALRGEGVEVLEASDPGALAAVVAGRQIDAYVQLPARTRAQGHSVIRRVRDFLASGLLERFKAVETVLPALSENGAVVLVAGHLPDVASTPDDQQARVALLRVLGRAVQAESAPTRIRVSVLGHDASSMQVVECALGREPARSSDSTDVAVAPTEVRYEDWRAEIIGLAYVES